MPYCPFFPVSPWLEVPNPKCIVLDCQCIDVSAQEATVRAWGNWEIDQFCWDPDRYFDRDRSSIIFQHPAKHLRVWRFESSAIFLQSLAAMERSFMPFPGNEIDIVRKLLLRRSWVCRERLVWTIGMQSQQMRSERSKGTR